MDEEVKKLMKVWVEAIIALSYCYLISSKIPKGLSRLISLLPIITLFIFLPLNLSSFHFTLFTSLFLAWLANFKLLLFAFGQGPLSSPTKLVHFILVAALPIKLLLQPHYPPPKSPQKTKNNTYDPSHQNCSSLVTFLKKVFVVFKVLLLFMVIQTYQYKKYLNYYVVTALNCCHLYLELEIFLAIFSIPARFLGFELEPQFNEPYLATSLQDFWGRRWNLMISSILRSTIYEPVKYLSTRITGPKWAPLPCVIAVFTVSGLMHDLILYYTTRAPPTWEEARYFALEGVFLLIEVLLKKMVGNRWRLHRAFSWPLTVAFMVMTSALLHFPVYLRHNLDEKCANELFIMIDFIKSIVVQLLMFIRVL